MVRNSRPLEANLCRNARTRRFFPPARRGGHAFHRSLSRRAICASASREPAAACSSAPSCLPSGSGGVRAGKATVYPARPNQRRSSGNKGLARRHRGPIGARVGFSAGLQQGAEIGLAVQYSLAILHLYGYGVPQSLIEAAKWFEKAGDQGDSNAQFSLGEMYWGGEGVPRDEELAAKWFRKAAEQGDIDAQRALAILGTGAGKREGHRAFGAGTSTKAA